MAEVPHDNEDREIFNADRSARAIKLLYGEYKLIIITGAVVYISVYLSLSTLHITRNIRLAHRNAIPPEVVVISIHLARKVFTSFLAFLLLRGLD